MERLCDDWQWLGKAEIGRAVTGSGMANHRRLRAATAQQRMQCKGKVKHSAAPLSSGNELRSNEQKSKKEWTEGGCNMAEVKTYTLTLNAQELHDLIEAALVCECQTAQIINGLKRRGLDMDAQKLVTQNARLARLVRRMQETKEAKKPCAD